jgi:hypothetical protein
VDLYTALKQTGKARNLARRLFVVRRAWGNRESRGAYYYIYRDGYLESTYTTLADVAERLADEALDGWEATKR